jgi:RNA-directed DNA polymerase
VEGRRHRVMGPERGKASGRPSPGSVSTRLQRIAELARESPGMAFTTLAHHVDIEFLRAAYDLTRKDGAVGVDGQTAEAYAADLEGNLASLLDRFKSGDYYAPLVRRVHIPKGDGTKTRPIGIPTFEDKVMQRAVAMVVAAVYEQDFLECSYGFRPGKSAHQALEALWRSTMKMNGGWVVEVDIRSFFDTLEPGHLRAFLGRRVRDGVLRRTIDKWLKAGVLEEGRVTRPEAGTPQGGVISPLLANIYLHEVMDRWFRDEVQPRLGGGSFMVRYADDLVVVCELESDARRVLEVLPKRFGKYGLELHPEKTRLVRFGRPKDEDEGPGPGSFDFLGFTHHWAKSRTGKWVVKRKTAGSRLSRALKAARVWLRSHRHKEVATQHRSLVRKLLGHYAYYGITGNAPSLSRFMHEVRREWRKWLGRRSQRAALSWERFGQLLSRYPLPPIRVVHSIYRNAANAVT